MSEPAWTKVPIKTAATSGTNGEAPVWDGANAKAIDPNKCGLTMADITSRSNLKENAERKYEHKEPDRICVVLNKNGKLGSVYSQVARLLARQGGWKRKRSTAGRFHMVFGEAGGNGIPFKRFSQVFRYDYGIKPLVNYNRNCKTITNKVMMTQTLQKHFRDSTVDRFLPESFLFWPGRDDVSQRDAFETYCESKESVWIVKPSNEAHGNGIFLSSSGAEILDHIDSQPEGSSPWVAQKYITSPLLITEGRKFDIRVWVILTHDYKVYVHKEGVLRTSSCAFDMRDLRNRYVHMTNHSVQSEHEDFGKYEEANEILFSDFSSLLQKEKGLNFEETIKKQIHSIVKEVFVAAKPIMESIDDIDDYHSFMFFGFDMIVDSSCKVWLQEVNATPAISQMLLNTISEDIIRTAIEPVFPRDEVESKNRAENGFVLVYQSDGKCDFVANMPAPETQDGVNIEAFGSEGKKSKK